MIRLGFTGTRQGLAPDQLSMMDGVVRRLVNISEVRHGGCVGADAQFHSVIEKLGLLPRLTVYPGHLSAYRATLSGSGFVTMEPTNTLDRNKVIVANSDVLIVCPKEFTEVVRSGTWSTWRYAKRCKCKTIIVYPDGEVAL